MAIAGKIVKVQMSFLDPRFILTFTAIINFRAIDILIFNLR